MADSSDGSLWSLFGLAGALGLCCTGTATLTGGAAIAGGTAAATAAGSGAAGGLGGILVSGIVTVFPLFIIGIILRRRGQE